MLRTIFVTLLFSLTISSISIPSWGASNFIRVPLGKGASIEIPKNWVVLSENRRVTIDAFVEAKGYRKTESTLNFAANHYDDRGRLMALMHVWFYPDNPVTQTAARQFTSNDVKEIDIEMRKDAEASLQAMGVRMLNWYGSEMREINGLYVLVQEHQHSGAGDAGLTRTRGIRVWRSPRSFSVTFSYREKDAVMLRPIVNHITNSLRQE